MKSTALILFGVALAFLPARATEPEPAVFVVHAADGADHAGPLRKLAADLSVRLGGDRPAVVLGQDVVSLRRQGQPLPAFPRRNVLLLTHGDRLPLDPKSPVELAEGRLRFHLQPPLRGPQSDVLSLARSFVAVLWLAAPAGTADPELLMRRLLVGKRARDLLLLRNGDVVEGNLTAIDRDKGCRVDAGNRKVTVAVSQLAAIAFNTELQARVRPQKTYAHLVLAGGGRLSLVNVELEAGAGVLKGKTLFGPRLEVPLDQVIALEPRLGKVVYLSDLKARAYEHTPFLNVSWPLMADAAVSGRPLCLAGSTHDKGLGMHSQSRVTYALGGDYRCFEALVGLDEHTGKKGRVRLQVLVDGKEQDLGRDKELTGAHGPLNLRIDVRKARELTLVVRFGSFGDVQAHVNWADARLIR